MGHNQYYEKLAVKILDPRAEFPLCSRPMEDLAYDLHAIEDVSVRGSGQLTRIPTGIAVELPGYGFLLKERSSWSIEGIIVVGGVIDPGYRGELLVNVVKFTPGNFEVKKGNRIAQMIPIPVNTQWIPFEAKELNASQRGEGGFGSSGK